MIVCIDTTTSLRILRIPSNILNLPILLYLNLDGSPSSSLPPKSILSPFSISVFGASVSLMSHISYLTRISVQLFFSFRNIYTILICIDTMRPFFLLFLSVLDTTDRASNPVLIRHVHQSLTSCFFHLLMVCLV